MLRALILENFKAFGGRRAVPIRPLTLIFGPNSAGKSAVLQSLLLLKQTIEDSETGDMPLRMSGSLVDLGNLRQAVYRHEARRICEITPILTFGENHAADMPVLNALHEALPDLEHQFGLGMRFRQSEESRATTIEALPLYYGEGAEPAAELRDVAEVRNRLRKQGLVQSVNPATRDQEGRLFSPTVNPNHMLWRRAFDDFRTRLLPVFVEKIEGLMESDEAWRLFTSETIPDFPAYFRSFEPEFLERQWDWYDSYTIRDYSQDLERDSLYPPLRNKNLLMEQSLEPQLPAGEARSVDPDRIYSQQRRDLLRYLLYDQEAGLHPNLASLAVEVSQQLQRALTGLIYLGPMRDFPERHYLFSGAVPSNVGRSGTMTADLLIGRPGLIERLNETLQAFDIGYRLEAQRLRDEEGGSSDVYAIRLIDSAGHVRVSLRDVGFGVSQVLPVLVQSLLAEKNIIAIEQPELHLHPRLQTELADVFLRSALDGRGNTFLLETHSEHLILRIMRRLRETSDGTLPRGMPPLRPDDVSIIYVQPTPEGSVPLVMDIDEEGQLMSAWPNGFFEEGFRERFA